MNTKIKHLIKTLELRNLFCFETFLLLLFTFGFILFSGPINLANAAFLTSDLQGTWYAHEIFSGNSSGWIYATDAIDNDGNLTRSATGSDGHMATSADTLLVDGNGIVTSNGDSSLQGAMSSDKNIMVSSHQNSGNYYLSVRVKGGGTFSTSDLAGTWNLQSLTAGQGSTWNGWERGTYQIDGSGNANISVNNRDNINSTSSAIFNIASGGLVTMTGGAPANSFNGVMSQDKQTIAATINDSGGGYNLVVLQKGGGPFSPYDLAGVWHGQTLWTGAAPGNETSTNYYIYSWFQIDNNGILTTPANPILQAFYPAFQGVMSSNKNMIVHTYTSAGSYDFTFLVKASPFTLTISQPGTGSGTISSSPSGISCGSTCSAAFDSSTVVSLSATANKGSNFSGWSGGGCSGTQTCALSVLANTTVSAIFAAGDFADVPSAENFYKYVEAIYNAGITTGCGSGDYCPSEDVTRDQMAAFLVRGTQVKAGQSPVNFTCTGGAACTTETPYFNDVSTADQFFPYVQKLKELGITTGCGNGQYCPSEYVTRDQMAAFLIRALYGANYTCNGGVNCATTAPYFSDVPKTEQFFPYIQKLYELGITTGCGNGQYCPSEYVTRDQMAAFLARAFLGLH